MENVVNEHTILQKSVKFLPGYTKDILFLKLLNLFKFKCQVLLQNIQLLFQFLHSSSHV